MLAFPNGLAASTVVRQLKQSTCIVNENSIIILFRSLSNSLMFKERDVSMFESTYYIEHYQGHLHEVVPVVVLVDVVVVLVVPPDPAGAQGLGRGSVFSRPCWPSPLPVIKQIIYNN